MKIILLLICMCLGCSCVRKNITSDIDIPLNISISSLGRAGYTLPDGAELGVYVAEDTPEGTYNGQSFQNIRAVVTGGQLLLDKEVMLNSTSANVYVYYPYNATYTNPRKIKVSSKAESTKNFLAGKIEDVNLYNPNVTLVLQHIYSMVRVKIRNLSGNTRYAKPHAVLLRTNIEEANIDILGDVDLKNCNIVPSTLRVPAINIPLSGNYEISSSFPADQNSIDFLLIPMDVKTGEIVIQVTFQSGSTSKMFPVSAGKWDAGEINVYELTIFQ